MNPEQKFTKKTHRARNGVGIDYIGYYPNNGYLNDSKFPYSVVYSDGVNGCVTNDGQVYGSEKENPYDLLPILPFSSQTHIRRDGYKIKSVLPTQDGRYQVQFVDYGYEYTYNQDGINSRGDKEHIITVEQYNQEQEEIKNAVCPFSKDKHVRIDGKPITYVEYEPWNKLWRVWFQNGLNELYTPEGIELFETDYKQIITVEEYQARNTKPVVDDVDNELEEMFAFMRPIVKELVEGYIEIRKKQLEREKK